MTFLGLAIVAVVAVVAFACSHKVATSNLDFPFVLEIHGKGDDKYLEVPNLQKFHQAMCDLKNHGGDISEIEFLPSGATSSPPYDPCSFVSPTPSNASATNDPNTTNRIRASDPKDVQAVLDAFLPTPTPAR
jgi:hypothetical protein